MGADFSIDSCTTGLLVHAADKTCIGDNDVLKAHIIKNGNKPLTKNTAIKIPHVRNQRLARAPIVESTSALIIALSMDEIASKRDRPIIVSIAENNILIFYILDRPLANFGSFNGKSQTRHIKFLS